ncbi:glycoside hydrolase family 2 protein [Lapidilactobacillus achengensis]|uniref:Glycoside hydrolase family 2 protein n=1 Tax=Lapidilactobacillus achengensis TaxID=2486000 RepID=A0ABW1UQV3_9LACO|nr:sugar-binding domain-containing protein [Lapidilactobacillus achengensis]
MVANNLMMRQEFPDPQFERKNWMNLNGSWDFSFDFGKSGETRRFFERKSWKQKINVPFCPESELSGVHYLDFMSSVWYHRCFSINADQLKEKVFIHFGAINYRAQIWVNGEKCGDHLGGYSSFSLDITTFVKAGENDIHIWAINEPRSGRQPCGKQSRTYASEGTAYSRVTGIWQTVWIEFVPEDYVKSVKFTPNISAQSVGIEVATVGTCSHLDCEIFYQGRLCGERVIDISGTTAVFEVSLDELHLWEVGHGRLYDVHLKLGQDEIYSYFGMREVSLSGERFLMNGRPIFQRLVLDQGYYPEGLYTAATEQELSRDIELSLACGFNGARLHQKAFEPRFLYHCDRLGYIVWAEQASWGLDYSSPAALEHFLPEWLEIMNRDINHPAIIGWCPLNETSPYRGRSPRPELTRFVYQITKQFDVTRPCIDVSGFVHTERTDVYDTHDYAADPQTFAKHYQKLDQRVLYDPQIAREINVCDLPVFVSEYGGIPWNVGSQGWGYGNQPESKELFIKLFRDLMVPLLNNPGIIGFCYTQLYDIEQEKNGLFTFSRQPKFDLQLIRQVCNQHAAYEESLEANKDE